MNRRKFLVGAGSAAVGSAGLLGAGAFSRVESQRAVDIKIAHDEDAYLGLIKKDPATYPNSSFVDYDEKGHLNIRLDDTRETDGGGVGVNSNSLSFFDDMFKIRNQGKQAVTVCIDTSGLEINADAERTEQVGNGEDVVIFYKGNAQGSNGLDGIIPIAYPETDGSGYCWTALDGLSHTHRLQVGEDLQVGLLACTRDSSLGASTTITGEARILADAGMEADQPTEEIPEANPRSWSLEDEDVVQGGPITLMELDSELTPGSSSHGPPEDHAAMVESILSNVTNGGEGILVLGGNPSVNTNIVNYWEGDVGNAPNVAQPVDFVYEIEDMESVDFTDYALIGVVSSDGQIPSGLTNAQNEVLINRRDDIADFVNQGGGLLGKTQYAPPLDNPWGYMDPFGEFEVTTDSYSSVNVTEDGQNMTFSQSGMDGWCCYHGVFLNYPGFLSVLIESAAGSNPGEAAALGGDEVIVERIRGLELFGSENVAVGEPTVYDVTVDNEDSDESIQNGRFEVEVAGNATVTDTLPDSFDLDSGTSETWEDAVEVTCGDPDTLDLTVRVIDADDTTMMQLTASLHCHQEVTEQ